MVGEVAEHTFIFDEEGTCKLTWKFSIVDIDGEKIIDKVQIEEREVSEGCSGHPQTLAVLLKSRSISSINIDELEKIYCKNWTSCGQILAQCLNKIIDDGQSD